MLRCHHSFKADTCPPVQGSRLWHRSAEGGMLNTTIKVSRNEEQDEPIQ